MTLNCFSFELLFHGINSHKTRHNYWGGVPHHHFAQSCCEGFGISGFRILFPIFLFEVAERFVSDGGHHGNLWNNEVIVEYFRQYFPVMLPLVLFEEDQPSLNNWAKSEIAICEFRENIDFFWRNYLLDEFGIVDCDEGLLNSIWNLDIVFEILISVVVEGISFVLKSCPPFFVVGCIQRHKWQLSHSVAMLFKELNILSFQLLRLDTQDIVEKSSQENEQSQEIFPHCEKIY